MPFDHANMLGKAPIQARDDARTGCLGYWSRCVVVGRGISHASARMSLVHQLVEGRARRFDRRALGFLRGLGS